MGVSMHPSWLTRLIWWFEDLGRVSPLKRLRWRLADIGAAMNGRILIGGLLLLIALVGGGFVAARAVAKATDTESTGPTVKIVTTREKVRVRVHGHVVTRWRTRKLYAKAQTVMQTETIHTPNGVRVVTHPVTRYHVVYRKHVITVNGKTRTVSEPVTNTQTLTSTKTQVVSVTNHVTDTQTVTVTQPVTVVKTTTVVSTETQTQTVPVTVTVTVPEP